MIRVLFSLLMASLLWQGCTDTREHFTESGMRYLLYVDSAGQTPKLGDYVTIELVCHTDDTVLLDTRKVGTPYRFRLEKIPFPGAYEEGLLQLSVGDSATFFVSADSLYSQLFGALSDTIPQPLTHLKKGGLVRYDVKLLKLQDYVTAEQEMQMRFSKLEKEEKRMLTEFISRNKIEATPDSSGLYMLYSQHGTGISTDTGKIITAYYRGRLLDGSIFNASSKDEPFRFMRGTGVILKGWEIAFRQARVGDRFTLIIPSKLGYGEAGLLDQTGGKFIVPPFASLIYDVVVVSVDDPSSMAKK